LTKRDGAAEGSKHNNRASEKKVTVTPEDVIERVEPHVLAILERSTLRRYVLPVAVLGFEHQTILEERAGDAAGSFLAGFAFLAVDR
jgi:hypothetical protein